jgi:hypothetical protein
MLLRHTVAAGEVVRVRMPTTRSPDKLKIWKFLVMMTMSWHGDKPMPNPTNPPPHVTPCTVLHPVAAKKVARL